MRDIKIWRCTQKFNVDFYYDYQKTTRTGIVKCLYYKSKKERRERERRIDFLLDLKKIKLT